MSEYLLLIGKPSNVLISREIDGYLACLSDIGILEKHIHMEIRIEQDLEFLREDKLKRKIKEIMDSTKNREGYGFFASPIKNRFDAERVVEGISKRYSFASYLIDA